MMLVAHLWQSTICAGLAALLAAFLFQAPARVRYRIWLLASLKFLVPFSLLVSIGSIVGAWLPAGASPSLSVAARWLDHSLPFLRLGALQPGPGSGVDMNRVLLFGLLIGWAVGAAGMIGWRWNAWHALSRVARAAVPLERGREAEALRRASRGWPRTPRIALLACSVKVEPGVRGLIRPEVLWPTGLSETLDEAELQAIMAHEVCHVVRRDNPVAVLQMVVETLFWFYPVVWWLGARLVGERERACDEEVVRMGADKRSYAEGILKVCGFCLGSAVECPVGVGGSGLTQRIVRIMEHHPSWTLSPSMRTMLASVGVLVVAAPLMTGVLDARRRAVDFGTSASRALESASDVAGQQTVYRIGPGIKNPKLIKEAKPGYTAEAMRARIQGLVQLEAVILRNGTVGDVKVTRSLDTVHGLDNEAVKTVKKWRFEPGSKDGKPVAVSVEIEMTFHLK